VLSNSSLHLKIKGKSEISTDSVLPLSYKVHTYFRHSEDRYEAEAFIRQQYERYFQAQIHDFTLN